MTHAMPIHRRPIRRNALLGLGGNVAGGVGNVCRGGASRARAGEAGDGRHAQRANDGRVLGEGLLAAPKAGVCAKVELRAAKAPGEE